MPCSDKAYRNTESGVFMKRKQRIGRERTPVGVLIALTLFGAACLIPFLTVISISLSSPKTISDFGYSVFPREFYTGGYEAIFASPDTVINAYISTIKVTIAGTAISLLSVSMIAYALARLKGSKLSVFITYFIYIPTLFSGGLFASYIMNTRVLGLGNSLWALILPGCVGVFNVFMIRTFIQQQPQALFEAAKIDGASEVVIYYKLAMPLAKPALATVGFNVALSYWNSWYNSMIYIRDNDKMTLQHMLQRLMMNMQEIMNEMNTGTSLGVVEIPTESFRMAMVIVTLGPMMLLFPFFQKYFVKGMVVGSVKG